MSQPKLTATESELLELLEHQRDCDDYRCQTCEMIDARLEDGRPHALENPNKRFDVVDGGLVTLSGQIERIYSMTEGYPIPASYRRSLHQLTEFITRLRQVLRLPITLSDVEEMVPKQKPKAPPPLQIQRAAPVARHPAPSHPARPVYLTVAKRHPTPPRTPVTPRLFGLPPRTPLLAA